jgi:YD repeat-containing protein
VTRLLIHHETRYRYERPVSFGPHRLLLRPRDSHGLRVEKASLSVSPPGDIRWTYDALGNCVCWFSPRGEATELSIVSRLLIERFPAPLEPFQPDNPHTSTPVVYSRDDRLALAPFMTPESEDDPAVTHWLLGLMDRPSEPALDFLLRFNRAIHERFAYEARDEEGVQTPGETLAKGSGSCRDFAWLMVEALRRAGYAARFVTGYLNSPAKGAVRGAGATHAWCEVFLPDLGWTEFDPTNGLAESIHLIPVAVSRTPREAAPISGSIQGDAGHSEMSVSVRVSEADGLAEAA